jgi:hypothetical protein
MVSGVEGQRGEPWYVVVWYVDVLGWVNRTLGYSRRDACIMRRRGGMAEEENEVVVEVSSLYLDRYRDGWTVMRRFFHPV